jgi:hypothetical protein
MWVYRQRDGLLEHNGKPVANGYSGSGFWKNKPKYEGLQGLGPIPRGLYKISLPYTSKNVGPFALALTPVGHDALDRTNLRIHGDSIEHPGEASHGCIVLARAVRVRIDQSGDRFLQVI